MSNLKKLPALLNIVICLFFWASICNVSTLSPRHTGVESGASEVSLLPILMAVSALTYLATTTYVSFARFGALSAKSRTLVNLVAFATYLLVQFTYALATGVPVYKPSFESLESLSFSLLFLLSPILFIEDGFLNKDLDFAK